MTTDEQYSILLEFFYKTYYRCINHKNETIIDQDKLILEYYNVFNKLNEENKTSHNSD